MRDTVLLLIACAAAFVLQVVLAPAISILGAMPNFLLVFVSVMAMFRPKDSTVVAAFLLGMIFDLIASGTPGVMAFLLAFVAFCTSRASVVLGNDTFSVSLLITMAASLIVEICYATYYVITTDVPVFDALLMRALPCALYDCAMCLIMLPVLSALFVSQGSRHSAPESSTIRLR